MQTPFDRLNETGQLKSYITHHGKDAQGNQLLPKMEYVGKDEVTALLKTASFKSLLLEADRAGNKSIKTEFYLDQATESGYVPASASSVLTHHTAPEEAEQFFANLFPIVEKSVLNALAIILGHNTNRFFATDGTPQNDLTHQEKANDRAPIQ